MVLDIGRVLSGVAARKRGQRGWADRHRPGAEQHIFEPNPHPLHIAIRDLVEARRIANAKQLPWLAVILQVLADPGEVVMHRNAVPLEERTRPDAGQLQDLR